MTPPNPDDVALCAEWLGVYEKPCPLPSGEFAWRIVERLHAEGMTVILDTDAEVVIYRKHSSRHRPFRGPDIYAACADYLRRGK